MRHLRHMNDRHQLTIPSEILKEVGVSETHALFSIDAQDGRIVLEPKKVTTQDLSEEDWGRLDRLVKKQVSGKRYTQYGDPQKARSHFSKFKK